MGLLHDIFPSLPFPAVPSLLILIPHNPLLQSLDLQRNHPRKIPTKCQIAPKEPKPRMARPPPHGPQLALLVEPPHILDPFRQLVAEDLPRRAPHVLVSRRENDLVGRQFRAVGKGQRVWVDGRDFLPLLDVDFAVGDERGGADVDIIPAATLEVFHEEAGVVGPVVELEAGLGETVEQLLVALRNLPGGVDVHAFEEGVGDGHEEEVGVLDGGSAFLVHAAEQHVQACLGAHDVGAAALHHRDVVAVLVKVLRDVVARVAAADDDGVLAVAVGLGPGELRRVAEAAALEVLHAFDVREVHLARVASGLDDVVRVQGPGFFLAVGRFAFDGYGPLAFGLVPMGVFEGCLGPDVEFEDLGVGFEPVGQFVLGGEDGPVLGEVDVGEMVVPDGIVQDELMVSVSPVVANAGVAVDDEVLDAQLFESCSDCQTSLSGAYDGSILVASPFLSSSPYQRSTQSAPCLRGSVAPLSSPASSFVRADPHALLHVVSSHESSPHDP